MKIVFSILLIIGCMFSFCRCGYFSTSNSSSDGGDDALYSLALFHIRGLDYRQTMDELLLATRNDTLKVCRALVMPRQTLVRLTRRETYPLDFTIKKTQELLINYYVRGDGYLDSLAIVNQGSIDWLSSSSVSEPIDPIWEKLIEDK